MRVLVAAGGSGGHIFPALAVLEELRARGALTAACWLGDPQGLEGKVANRPWIRFEPVITRGLPRDRPWVWPLHLAQNGLALFRAIRVIRRFRPQVVLAMGGYPTVAPALAAKLLGVPLACHEQNALMGWANRLVSRLADLVLLSFPNTEGCPRRARVMVTGNPVRPGIAQTPRELGTELLVLGGSLGSQTVVEALTRWAPSLGRIPDLRVRVVAGQAGDPEGIAENLRRAGLSVEVVGFTEEMGELLSRARLVIARAGASTVAELGAAGRPAVLIPWSKAASNHQERNAQHLAKLGGCLVLPERELDRLDLGELVARLWQDDQRLWAMACAARAASPPGAAKQVAAALIELASKKNTGRKELP